MYQTTQFFNPIYEFGESLEISAGGVALFLIGFFLTGRVRMSVLWAVAVTLIIIFLHWCTFYRLDVIVDDRRVIASYGIGFFKREFPISEIASCESISDAPLVFRYFIPWGLVIWPIERPFSSSDRMIALPMRSREAIRIRMKDGEATLIGTRESNQLSDVINEIMEAAQKNRTVTKRA